MKKILLLLALLLITAGCENDTIGRFSGPFSTVKSDPSLSSLTDTNVAGVGNDECLTYDTASSKWVPDLCSTGSVGGSDTQIQYNNGGVMDGDSNLTWASSTQILTVTGTTSLANDIDMVDDSKILLSTDDTKFVRYNSQSSVVEFDGYVGASGVFDITANTDADGGGVYTPYITLAAAGSLTLGAFGHGTANYIENIVGEETDGFRIRNSGTKSANFDIAALTTARSFAFPDEAGTFCTTGSVCSGYQASGDFVTASDWTTIDNYPSDCATGVVVGLGDTLTCTATSTWDTDTNTTPSDDNWTIHDSYPTGCNAGEYVNVIADTLTCTDATTEINTEIGNVLDGTDAFTDFNGNDIIGADNLNWGGFTDLGESGVVTWGNMLWTEIDSYPSACSAGDYMTAIGDTLTCSDPDTESDATWTLHNSYPSACTGGQYVTAIGDTLTCSTPAGGATSFLSQIGDVATTTTMTDGDGLFWSGTGWQSTSTLTVVDENVGVGSTTPTAQFVVDDGVVGTTTAQFGDATNPFCMPVGTVDGGIIYLTFHSATGIATSTDDCSI